MDYIEVNGGIEFCPGDDFDPVKIFECGQCFRWNMDENGDYVGVAMGIPARVRKTGDRVFISGTGEDFKEVWLNYFDLQRNYGEIRKSLCIDSYMQAASDYGAGIRILNPDRWEALCSFIISQCNNIPRIKKIVETLCSLYGEEKEFEGKVYYTFPDAENLSRATIDDLRQLGLGFRDKRIFNTTQKILNKEFDLEKISKLDDTDLIKNELLKLDGVGPKVADCILLFALHRFDVFPIDVWVRRVMNELYIHNEDEEKVKKEDIIKLAKEKFKDYQAMAQQYLFYWKRENS